MARLTRVGSFPYNDENAGILAAKSTNATNKPLNIIQQPVQQPLAARAALKDVSNRINVAVPAQSNIMTLDNNVVKPVVATRKLEERQSVSVPQAAVPPVSWQSEPETSTAAPVSVQPQTDNKSTHGMDETTLEDSVAALSVDIEDSEDPQSVTEYVNDIYEYFRQTEARRAPSPNYMSKQVDLNAKMREILIDWLVEVHLKFKLRHETLFLTVNLIDRFLERKAVARTKLQLVGCTAMLIASKYEEIYSPEVKDFVYISDKAYTREQILAMETIILNTLEFNLTVPSSLQFASRFLKIARATKQVSQLTHYLLELTLPEYKFLKYLPSEQAAGCVSLACRMGGMPSWSANLQSYTQFAESALVPVVQDVYAVLTVPTPKYFAVRKKYSHTKLGEVAKIPAPNATFLGGSV